MGERVIVIGAGVVGSFAALELALRGADVLLVEGGARPSGATYSIAGVLHGGARFSASDPDAAAACRDESAVMRRLAADFLIGDRGYFAVVPSSPEDYVGQFESSTSRLGIRAKRVPPSELRAERLRSGAIRGLYETDDAVIDLPEFALHVLARAVEEGAEYLNSAEVASAEPAGGGYLVRIRRGSSELSARGPVIVAAGHGSPALLAGAFGVDLGAEVARGSHLALGLRLGSVVQLVRPPGWGDLFAPVRGGSFVGPTLVRGGDPGSMSAEEASALLKSASELFEVSWEDAYGWSSTGRLLFDRSRSLAPPDLLAEPREGLVVAYASNMTCGRRVAAAASEVVASFLGLRGGSSTSSPSFSLGAERPRLSPWRERPIG